MLLVRMQKSRDRARHAGRERAHPAALSNGVALLIEEHVARRPGRRHFAEVDRGGPPIGEPDHHEPAAAEIAGLGMRHRQCEANGNRAVDRVSARAQHLDPDARRVRFRGSDQPMPRVNGLARRASAHDGGADHEREHEGGGVKAEE